MSGPKHCILIFDKSPKGLNLLRELQSGDSRAMFLTAGVQKWLDSDIQYLLRWFTVDKHSGQTMMAPGLNSLVTEAIPAAINGIGSKSGIQLILGIDEEFEDLVSERFKLITE